LRAKTAQRLLEAAKTSIGSLAGPVAETIVRTVVDQVRFAQNLKCQYEKLLVESYRSLPVTNHLDSIIGFGEVTAAVLTAKIVSIDRFDRPEQLVGYWNLSKKVVGIGGWLGPSTAEDSHVSKGRRLGASLLVHRCDVSRAVQSSGPCLVS
jgi:transposase